MKLFIAAVFVTARLVMSMPFSDVPLYEHPSIECPMTEVK